MKHLLLLLLLVLTAWTARAGVYVDSFEDASGLDSAWWQAEAGAVQFEDGRLLLSGRADGPRGILEFQPVLPDDYELQLEFQPSASHFDGYGFTVSARSEDCQHPGWYVEFLGGQVAFWGQRDGNWEHFSGARIDDWPERLLRLSVRNLGDRVEIWVEKLPSAGEDADDSDIFEYRPEGQEDTARIVCRTTFRHDTGAGTRLTLECRNAVDMTAYLDNFKFGGKLVNDSAHLPQPAAASAGQIASSQIEAQLQPDGRIFLSRPGAEKPFGSLLPEMQSLPDFAALPMVLTENRVADGRIEQRWQSGAFELRLTAVAEEQPWVKISTAVANLTDQAGRVRVIYRFTPTPESGLMTDLIAFRKKWIHYTLPIADKIGILRRIHEWTWGTVAFSYPEEMIHDQDIYETDPITGALVQAARTPVDAYVPLAAVHNDHSGLVMTVDPRSAFLFDAGAEGISVGHIYYLPAEQGFVDDGFFDGSGEATYTVYAGYPVANDWGRLWRDYYCAQNEWLRSGPEPVTLITGEEFPDADQSAYAGMLRRAGVNSIGTGVVNMFRHEEKVADFIAAGTVAEAQQQGYLVPLWTNIFMAPDLDGHGKHWDPQLDYRNFKDAWVLGADGKPLPNWDGFLCTPSPKYSFGQFEFKRLTDWMTKYHFDGIFLDLYAFNPDVDWGRRYEHFPFYPLQVATIEYCRQLSDWCIANGRIFILNCPHPSMMVWHLAHNFQGDTLGIRGHMSIVEKLACAAAGRSHTLLGVIESGNGSGQWLKESIGAVFYGETPSPWRLLKDQSDAELAVIGELFGRNRRLIDWVGHADIRGGDLDRALWFAGPEGRSGYVTLANRSTDLAVRQVSLGERVELAPGRYQAVLWDLVSPPVVLAEGDESLASRKFEVILAPEAVQVLCFVTPEMAGQLIAAGR